MTHYLPTKVPGYLRRLHLQYSQEGKHLQRDLIAASRSFVIEATEYDNWNGGIYGHDVQLFMPLEELAKVNSDDQKTVTEDICADLNKLSSVENEFFRAVRFEADDESDQNLQGARPLSSRPVYDPDSLSIWKPGMVRLFISHRDEHKTKANELANALEPYGISSFVAHDTIEPMTRWRTEIIKGLETMELMLAFVTDDFHESTWTNQEVGFALGRNIPVVSLKLQQRDPDGFIGDQQALRGNLNDPTASVPDIYELLAEKLGNKERLQSGLISAFVASPSFDETRRCFDRMDEVVNSLSDDEVASVTDGFAVNDQLHRSIYLTNRHQRLCRFLKHTTGKDYVIDGTTISPVGEAGEDKIPF